MNERSGEHKIEYSVRRQLSLDRTNHHVVNFNDFSELSSRALTINASRESRSCRRKEGTEKYIRASVVLNRPFIFVSPEKNEAGVVMSTC